MAEIINVSSYNGGIAVRMRVDDVPRGTTELAVIAYDQRLQFYTSGQILPWNCNNDYVFSLQHPFPLCPGYTIGIKLQALQPQRQSLITRIFNLPDKAVALDTWLGQHSIPLPPRIEKDMETTHSPVPGWLFYPSQSSIEVSTHLRAVYPGGGIHGNLLVETKYALGSLDDVYYFLFRSGSKRGETRRISTTDTRYSPQGQLILRFPLDISNDLPELLRESAYSPAFWINVHNASNNALVARSHRFSASL